jgi:Asp-tRNA(Asn)/Glu-tRNA(Gln) amidotransferase A subunit family amidase
MEVARSAYLPRAAASWVLSLRADAIRSGRCSAISLVALSAEHVVTHSVRDAAAALDATAGVEIGDPYVAPPTKSHAARRVPPKLRRGD